MGSSIAVVTGGASGLGKAVAERFIKKGYSVAIVDLNTVQNGLRLDGASYFEADVSNQEQARQVVRQIADELGQIDILINAAGIIRRGAAMTMSDETLEAVLDVNLLGTTYMCQAAVPFMMQSGGGAIVNFASMLAHYGSTNLLAYAASKGGVVQVTKCLAVEWAEYNIRVNAVSPGYIETPLASGATKDPVFRDRILSRTPQRRFGTPEEVAAAIDFLSSEEASFITGVVLPVDGGLLAGDPCLFPPASS